MTPFFENFFRKSASSLTQAEAQQHGSRLRCSGGGANVHAFQGFQGTALCLLQHKLDNTRACDGEDKQSRSPRKRQKDAYSHITSCQPMSETGHTAEKWNAKLRLAFGPAGAAGAMEASFSGPAPYGTPLRQDMSVGKRF